MTANEDEQQMNDVLIDTCSISMAIFTDAATGNPIRNQPDRKSADEGHFPDCVVNSKSSKPRGIEIPYVCYVCGYTSFQICDFIEHVTTHKEEEKEVDAIGVLDDDEILTDVKKPYECGVCGFASYRNSDVTRHMAIHTGEGQIDTLTDSELNHKILSGKKPHSCDVNGFTSHEDDDKFVDNKILTDDKELYEDTGNAIVNGIASHLNTDFNLDHDIKMVMTTEEEQFSGTDRVYTCHDNNGDDVTNHNLHTDGRKPDEHDVCDEHGVCVDHEDNIEGLEFETEDNQLESAVSGYRCNDNINTSTGDRKPCEFDVEVNRHTLTHTEDEGDADVDANAHTSHDESDLTEHKIATDENKPFECDVCGYGFRQEENMIEHIGRTHVGEKILECSIETCRYACTTRASLLAHKKVHIGEKRYKCEICGFAFTRNDHLKRHKMLHVGNKPFECNLCNYVCTYKWALMVHMRSHTGEKPHRCSQCDYACSRKDTLTKHMKIHTGEKPFKCNFCGYACARKYNLTDHVRKHTGEKPHKCDLCDFTCARRYNLTSHKKKFHKV